MNTIRRSLLAGSALALAGCAATATPGTTTTTTTTTPASIISTILTMVTGIAGMFNNPAVQAALSGVLGGSGALANITKLLGLATGAASTLSTDLPATTGASTAQIIDGYINTAVTVADSPPLVNLIPAPFGLVLTAVSVVLPTVEAWVNSLLPASMTTVPTVPVPTPVPLVAPTAPVVASARRKFAAAKPAMTQAEALATLAQYSKAA